MPGTLTVALPGRSRPRFSLRRWPAAGTGVLVLVLSLPALLRAQSLPDSNDGVEKLDKAFGKEQQTLITRLGKGEIKEWRPEDEATIDLCAKWYVYRFTWQEDPRAKPKNQTDAGRMQSLYGDFEKLLDSFARGRPDNKPFLVLFGKKVIAHAREVVVGIEKPDGSPKPNDKVIARVNVARVLARLAAEPEQQEVADLLVELIQDKDQNPGVLVWAFQGLGNLLALEQPRVDDKGARIEPLQIKKEREEKIIRALIGFIERKLPVSASMPVDELRGWQWLRREAVQALGKSRAPAVLDEKKKLVGPTALVLLRVLRKDTSFNLPPGPAEQLEAAVGLSRLQSKLYDAYQPDYTAHEIGMFVAEFGTRYVNEGGDRGWRVGAARLTDALTALKADVDKNVKDAATKKYVTDVVAKSVELLGGIERKAAGVNAAGFGDWIGKTLPKSESVYRDMPDAKVNPPAEQ
jgi:hypothetical protein